MQHQTGVYVPVKAHIHCSINMAFNHKCPVLVLHQVAAGFISLTCRQVLCREYMCPGGGLWLQFLQSVSEPRLWNTKGDKQTAAKSEVKWERKKGMVFAPVNTTKYYPEWVWRNPISVIWQLWIKLWDRLCKEVVEAPCLERIKVICMENLEFLSTRQRAEGTFHTCNGGEGSLDLWVEYS